MTNWQSSPPTKDQVRFVSEFWFIRYKPEAYNDLLEDNEDTFLTKTFMSRFVDVVSITYAFPETKEKRLNLGNWQMMAKGFITNSFEVNEENNSYLWAPAVVPQFN